MPKTNKIQLNLLGLPVIESIDDFSVLTHVSTYTIYQLSKFSEKHYYCFEIPKKSGKKRLICQPSRGLKGIQAWILVNILNKLNVSVSCKGFEKGTSIADNARPHIEANTILSMDLKDFFPSITRLKVFNIFKTIGYNGLISTLFTNLTVYQDVLPQGSPCSPKLANLVTWQLDKRIQGYVGKRGITYTRYADDLTFSGLNPQNIARIIYRINNIIEDEGLIVNKEKTRLNGSSRAKIVTGLILSKNSFGIGKKKYKTLRSKIYSLTKPIDKQNFELINQVNGYLAFTKSVDIIRYKRAKRYIEELRTKYPETFINKLNSK